MNRAVDGARWYADGIEGMLDGRRPLPGPVSNIASWNYPMSVLVHAMLVQALAGDAVIAKAPTDGGLACLTLACALIQREGVPVTLVSGSGSELSEPLVRSPEIGCVSFVGGRDTGYPTTIERILESSIQHYDQTDSSLKRMKLSRSAGKLCEPRLFGMNDFVLTRLIQGCWLQQDNKLRINILETARV